MKKNILFLLSRFLDGGLDTVLVEYVNAIVKYTDYNVTLAIGLDYKDSEVFLHRISPQVKIIHIISSSLLTLRKRLAHKNKKNAAISIADEVIANPLRKYLTTGRLDRLTKENDVVIDFDSCHYTYVKALRKKHPDYKTKFIAFSHFSILQLMQQNERRTKRTIERWDYYDYIVTISDAMKEEAQKLRPDIRDRIVRIYNSLDLDNVASKAQEEVLDTAIQHPFILAVERLEESQKDLSTLIRAYALYTKKHKEQNTPYLYIIGEGKSRPELETLIKDLGLQEKVRLLGFISNPYPWIKAAVAMVHSSKFEGLPTVLIEGLMMGKIIASSDCPTGPSEILNNGKAGLLIPVGNAEQFAEAIEIITTDNAKKEEFMHQAAEHAKIFSSEACINQLQNIL